MIEDVTVIYECNILFPQYTGLVKPPLITLTHVHWTSQTSTDYTYTCKTV